jgi:hypothetical protein
VTTPTWRQVRREFTNVSELLEEEKLDEVLFHPGLFNQQAKI